MSESKPCQMTAEEAIYRIEDHIRVHKIGEYPHIFLYEALQMAIVALRRVQPANEQKPKGAHHKYCRYCGTDLDAPGAMFSGCCWEESKIADNEPLTLEELKNRKKPVWVNVPKWIPDGGYYALCDSGNILPPSGYEITADDCLAHGWIFLDHPPEGSGE